VWIWIFAFGVIDGNKSVCPYNSHQFMKHDFIVFILSDYTHNPFYFWLFHTINPNWFNTIAMTVNNPITTNVHWVSVNPLALAGAADVISRSFWRRAEISFCIAVMMMLFIYKMVMCPLHIYAQI
jgi:hypothetical protein